MSLHPIKSTDFIAVRLKTLLGWERVEYIAFQGESKTLLQNYRDSHIVTEAVAIILGWCGDALSIPIGEHLQIESVRLAS